MVFIISTFVALYEVVMCDFSGYTIVGCGGVNRLYVGMALIVSI